MSEEKLQQSSTQDLHKKKKSHGVLMGLLTALSVALSYFLIRNWLQDNDFDFATATIIICTIGGLVSMIPEWNTINKILKTRKD